MTLLVVITYITNHHYLPVNEAAYFPDKIEVVTFFLTGCNRLMIIPSLMSQTDAKTTGPKRQSHRHSDSYHSGFLSSRTGHCFNLFANAREEKLNRTQHKRIVLPSKMCDN